MALYGDDMWKESATCHLCGKLKWNCMMATCGNRKIHMEIARMLTWKMGDGFLNGHKIFLANIKNKQSNYNFQQGF